MQDSDTLAKIHFKEKVQESVEASERDNQTRLEDAVDFLRKYEYLKTFRDDNKRVSLILQPSPLILILICLFPVESGET